MPASSNPRNFQEAGGTAGPEREGVPPQKPVLVAYDRLARSATYAMTTRRQFLGALSLAPSAMAAPPSLRADAPLNLAELGATDKSPQALAGDEDFWHQIGLQFTCDRSMVNLNNGGVSPAPLFVQLAMKKHLDFSNQAPPYHMWRILQPHKEGVRQRLAHAHGVDPEEIALTRNASESLMICQFGMDLKDGDEVLTTNQDYPRMVNTFKQRQAREGIRLKQFSVPVPIDETEKIVDLFEAQIRPGKTKMILCSHMINLTGQILPVKEISALGRKYGIPVIIDGAHSFAHFDFKLADLECDFFATSLHKWLFAPHGTGLLYMRKERIPEVWPLMAAAEKQKNDIRKFEEIGTHPLANYLAISEALTFHQGIGGKRKEARLIYLRDYWAKALLQEDRVRLHTSLKPGWACGIANVQIEGLHSGKLASWLWKHYRILVTAIHHDEFQGLRISPSVYTKLSELDRFIDAVRVAIRSGIEED
ncbi:MAG: aminotransferase class V-fold PLP-dependent enzyme [Planctomycetota bacterium]|nr:MAG: aminotransferase class V-fold PLP-dependent enzyme [Planctomycetota bacterium]